MICKWIHISLWELVNAIEWVFQWDWQQIKVCIIFMSLAFLFLQVLMPVGMFALHTNCCNYSVIIQIVNEGVIMIKVNIYSLWTWLLHLHTLELQLCANVWMFDEGVIMIKVIKVNIYSLWTWLLHLHTLELLLCANVWRSGLVLILLKMSNHNKSLQVFINNTNLTFLAFLCQISIEVS